MTWTPGHETITELLAVGHLARISGDAANGYYLLEQAHHRLASARVIAGTDPIGSFELAYDGVRQAAVALLAQQGLRAKLEGCRYSNFVASRETLICGDARCLTSCPRAFVSRSCHFFQRW